MTDFSQHPVTASGNTDLALLGAVLGIDEPAVLSLGGGIGFMAATFDYAEITTLTFVFRAHPVPFVDAVLPGGHPALVVVDRTGVRRDLLAMRPVADLTRRRLGDGLPLAGVPSVS